MAKKNTIRDYGRGAKLEFDQSPQSYNNNLMKGLCLSGEPVTYFAQQRVNYVHIFLKSAGKPVKSILEFGCGIGNNIEFLAQYFPQSRIIGLDISQESLKIAQERFKNNSRITFESTETSSLNGEKVDLIFINGVFHHIAPKYHLENLYRLCRILKKGGVLFVFENNPFNPGTRWVMKRIPFDRDAITVNPYRFAEQVESMGFGHISIQFYFIFPKFLAFLRFLEHHLRSLPLGAQYSVIGFKKDD